VKLKSEKIVGYVGYVLLALGIIMILLSIFEMIVVFTGRNAPPILNFNFSDISTNGTLLISGQQLDKAVGFVAWGVLMAFVMWGGGKIASLGVNLLREIRIEIQGALKTVEEKETAKRPGDGNLMLDSDTLIRIRSQLTCPKCGALSSVGSVFCYLCGQRLIGEAADTVDAELKVKPKPVKPEPKVKPIELETPLSRIDDIVFNYVVQHGGTISIRDASKGLNMTEEDLRASIDRLRQAHKLE
jgi:uncharacterized Zn finger protein (UPF0148 family)